ncbi:hypothetical protein ACP4OV_028366 [Aristida adscensionis]
MATGRHEPGCCDRCSTFSGTSPVPTIDRIMTMELNKARNNTAARTSVLSTRWKHLPWLLQEVTINARDFLPLPDSYPIESEHMVEAMASSTKAISRFLGPHRSEATISRLQLNLYLVNGYSDVIGPLVSKAIDTGIVNDFDLAILDEKEPVDCYDEDVLRQGCLVDGFFSAYPTADQRAFMLNEILSDTSAINDLTLDFHGEKLWVQPEGKRLYAAFNKLRKLSLHGVFIEFDLLWTIVLLEAAPSVEIFDIEVWDHPCLTDPEVRRTFSKRTGPSWKSEFTSTKEWLMKVVQITGFSPMKQHMAFIRAVLKRAPNLQTVVLKDFPPCQRCEELGALPRSERLPAECVFPKGKDEQDRVANQLIGDMTYSHVQIVLGN